MWWLVALSPEDVSRRRLQRLTWKLSTFRRPFPDPPLICTSRQAQRNSTAPNLIAHRERVRACSSAHHRHFGVRVIPYANPWTSGAPRHRHRVRGERPCSWNSTPTEASMMSPTHGHASDLRRLRVVHLDKPFWSVSMPTASSFEIAPTPRRLRHHQRVHEQRLPPRQPDAALWVRRTVERVSAEPRRWACRGGGARPRRRPAAAIRTLAASMTSPGPCVWKEFAYSSGDPRAHDHHGDLDRVGGSGACGSGRQSSKLGHSERERRLPTAMTLCRPSPCVIHSRSRRRRDEDPQTNRCRRKCRRRSG